MAELNTGAVVSRIPPLEELRGMLADSGMFLAELTLMEGAAPCSVHLNLTMPEYLDFVRTQGITALYYTYSFSALTAKTVTLPPALQMQMQAIGTPAEISWGAGFGIGHAKPTLATKEVLDAVSLCNKKLSADASAAAPCKLVLYAPHPSGHFIVLKLTAPVTAAEVQAPTYDSICRALVVAKEEPGYAGTTPPVSRLREVKAILFSAFAQDGAQDGFMDAHAKHIQYAEQICADPLSPGNPLREYAIWYSSYERAQIIKCLDAAWQLHQEGIVEYTPALDVRLPLSLYI